MNPSYQKILNRQQLSAVIGISPRGIRHHEKQGLIPVIKLGRRRLYRLSSVLEALSAISHHVSSSSHTDSTIGHGGGSELADKVKELKEKKEPIAHNGRNFDMSESKSEFFRLPARGGDPVFGLSRSFYYNAERAGLIKLTRLRLPGNVRGPVLVSVVAVRQLIKKHSQ